MASTRAISSSCLVAIIRELQILMTLMPSEGTFKLQALLSNNSWVITSDCKLTGGFALFVWFDGEHKGDIVVMLGGYHPRVADSDDAHAERRNFQTPGTAEQQFMGH